MGRGRIGVKKKREVGLEERVESPFSPLRLSPSQPPPPLLSLLYRLQLFNIQKAGIAILPINLKKAYRFEDEDEYDDEIWFYTFTGPLETCI